jgi:hypothetical protein
MARSSSKEGRAENAVQSFKNAAETIGECTPGMSLFAITRGQWSMIDAVLHVLDQVGPGRTSYGIALDLDSSGVRGTGA